MKRSIFSAIVASIVISTSVSALEVKHDGGGLVETRYHEIAQLHKTGEPVRISGECMSTCTMFLVLGPQTCVDTKAVFGFHGPSFFGISLSKKDFELWSNYISEFYPEPIRSWYLNEARYSINTTVQLSAKELVRLGATTYCK